MAVALALGFGRKKKKRVRLLFRTPLAGASERRGGRVGWGGWVARIPSAFEPVLQGCRNTLAGHQPKCYDHQTQTIVRFLKEKFFILSIMHLSAYNFAHTTCMSIFSITDVFCLVQFAATRRWLGSTAGTYSSCVLQFNHHIFSIYTYVRTSFSGPRRCVWVFQLSSFDSRGPV